MSSPDNKITEEELLRCIMAALSSKKAAPKRPAPTPGEEIIFADTTGAGYIYWIDRCFLVYGYSYIGSPTAFSPQANATAEALAAEALCYKFSASQGEVRGL